MSSLYEVGGRDGHIVAQIVETKLIVRSEGDVSLIGTAASLAVGLMLVDTVDREAVELVERTHPLGVTLGEVVVDGDHMYTIASQGVKEDGQGSDERLTFTRSHLGNLTLMEHGTTEELYIIVYHLPFQVVATSGPVVMIDSLVAIDGDEVLAWVACQFTVEVGSRDDGLFVLGKTTGSLLHD